MTVPTIEFEAPDPGSCDEAAFGPARLALEESGAVVLRDYFSSDAIQPVLDDVHRLIDLQFVASGGTPDPKWTLEERTCALAEIDRPRIGAIYDTAMKLASTRRLATGHDAFGLVEQMLQSDLVAMSNNIQTRIDLPTEDRFLFRHWHQDYTSAMVSERGVALWIPLAPITEAMGPVELLLGSHRNGLLPTTVEGPHYIPHVPEDADTQAVSMPVDVGDVVVFDLMTVHRSGLNRGTAPRWTACFRYCDLEHMPAVKRGWPSFYAQGCPFPDVHPEAIEQSVTNS